MSRTLPASEAALKALIVAEIEAARMRTLGLLDPLGDDELEHQHSTIMSPLVWDLAHIGYFEELWLLRTIGGQPPTDPHFDDLYDAFQHPRADRRALPLLGVSKAHRYLAEVRARVLAYLEQVDLVGDDPLLRDGFVYGMIIQHELQHCETMLQTLQLANSSSYPPVEESFPGYTTMKAEEALIDVPVLRMGTSGEPWAYDNERPEHTVELSPFFIDTHPVTNHDFALFIADGGYEDDRLWHPAGWEMIRRESISHPMSWRPAGSLGWTRRRFGRDEPLPPTEPVQHVSWYEASAFARWAGKRLPTEAEWEAAARVGTDGTVRRYPWGDGDATADHTTLAAERFAPAPVGSHIAGASAWGVRQLIGDVWEWTSSTFSAYPGFVAFPYPEYSEVFFGEDHRVLRGGSWATHPLVARTTFRNWDYPQRRQLFAGFRCARDAQSDTPRRALRGLRFASVEKGK
jgi:gamma-glutamyl hercynylcysteine S-oxide synthase